MIIPVLSLGASSFRGSRSRVTFCLLPGDPTDLCARCGRPLLEPILEKRTCKVWRLVLVFLTGNTSTGIVDPAVALLRRIGYNSHMLGIYNHSKKVYPPCAFPATRLDFWWHLNFSSAQLERLCSRLSQGLYSEV